MNLWSPELSVTWAVKDVAWNNWGAAFREGLFRLIVKAFFIKRLCRIGLGIHFP